MMYRRVWRFCDCVDTLPNACVHTPPKWHTTATHAHHRRCNRPLACLHMAAAYAALSYHTQARWHAFVMPPEYQARIDAQVKQGHDTVAAIFAAAAASAQRSGNSIEPESRAASSSSSSSLVSWNHQPGFYEIALWFHGIINQNSTKCRFDFMERGCFISGMRRPCYVIWFRKISCVFMKSANLFRKIMFCETVT